MRPAWSTHLQPRANNQTTGRIPLKPRIALTLALSTLAAACAAPGGSGERANGYAVDGRSPVVKSAYNICWRTGYWTPAAATVECDPDLAPRPKPAAAPPAPIAAAPVPAVPIPAPAPPPPPVAVTPPPPPPPPVPVAAPAPPPKPKRCDATITLQSDQTFGFGSATLTPGARTRIDSEVLPRLQGCASVDLILVSGHTDRIGSQQYNQKLSEQRANAVSLYMVSKGAPVDKIDTIGMGKTVPAKFCPDTRNQAELQACLAPNRRVEIEIKGPGK